MKLFNKRRSFIFFLIILAIWATTGPSFAFYSLAFRCGTYLVSEGDTKPEVAHKCGEPDHVDYWEEARISRYYPSTREYDLKIRSYRLYREPFLVKEYVKIDVWTYNFGPTRFIRYLTFENGILTEINTGKSGY